MRDNGLPYFRPGESRTAEMAEQLEVLAAQERERVYQVRLRAVRDLSNMPQGFYDRLRASLSK